MGEPMTQERLSQYVYLKMEVDHQIERIARLKNQETFPAMRESDGSQHTPGTGDRMERAIIRRMEYEDKIADQLHAAIDEMQTIERAVDSLPNGQERELLRLRYIDGQHDEDGEEVHSRHMRWNDVAVKMYGTDEEKNMQAVFRIHRLALRNIGKGEW